MGYCPPGEDATVDWPKLDLKMQNNSSYPLYFTTSFSPGAMTVEIYGMTTGYESIQIESQTIETIPAPEEIKYVDDPTLPAGKTETDKQRRDGSRAVSFRVYYNDGVEVKREELPKSYYKPIEGVVKKGTGAPLDPPPQSEPPNEDPKPKPPQDTPNEDELVIAEAWLPPELMWFFGIRSLR